MDDISGIVGIEDSKLSNDSDGSDVSRETLDGCFSENVGHTDSDGVTLGSVEG